MSTKLELKHDPYLITYLAYTNSTSTLTVVRTRFACFCCHSERSCLTLETVATSDAKSSMGQNEKEVQKNWIITYIYYHDPSKSNTFGLVYSTYKKLITNDNSILPLLPL